MRVIHADGESNYNIEDIKLVKTDAKGLYPTSAFIPEAFKAQFDFDTRYGSPAATDNIAKDTTAYQRTLEIAFNGDSATVVGNTYGFDISNQKAQVSIITIQSGVLNIFSSAFNGKGIHADADVNINGSNVNIITTGSGTLTDASFPDDAELGTRAILATNVNVNEGRLRAKIFGHNGGVGVAGTKKVTFNGALQKDATYTIMTCDSEDGEYTKVADVKAE